MRVKIAEEVVTSPFTSARSITLYCKAISETHMGEEALRRQLYALSTGTGKSVSDDWLYCHLGPRRL